MRLFFRPKYSLCQQISSISWDSLIKDLFFVFEMTLHSDNDLCVNQNRHLGLTKKFLLKFTLYWNDGYIIL